MILFMILTQEIVFQLKNSQYTFNEAEKECELTKYSGDSNLNLTSFVEFQGKNYTLYSIGEGCFQYSKIKSIVLPENLRVIKSRAFYHCEELSYVEFGSLLEHICLEAFCFCISLKEVIFKSKSIVKFEHCAFGHCNGIRLIKFPAKFIFIRDPFFNVLHIKVIELHDDFNSEDQLVKLHIPLLEKYYIQNGTFFKTLDDVLYTANLERIIKYPPSKNQSTFHIPNTVKVIEHFCFSDSLILKTINFSESEISIRHSCFIQSSIQEITIPKACNDIGNRAFLNCLKLKYAIIEANIVVLPDNIFDGCISLEYVHLSQIRELGSGCFTFCHSIRSFCFSETIWKIGESSFYGCRNLNLLDFSKVQEIHENAFFKCNSLTHIEIPVSVRLIDKKAFSHSCLISVRILGDTTLNYEAFGNCLKLTKFEYEGEMFNEDLNQLDGTNVKYVLVTYKYEKNTFAGKPTKGNFVLYI